MERRKGKSRLALIVQVGKIGQVNFYFYLLLTSTNNEWTGSTITSVYYSQLLFLNIKKCV